MRSLKQPASSAILILSLLLLNSCGSENKPTTTETPIDNFSGIDIKFLVGSALGDFCNQAAGKLNQQKPKLPNGKEYRLSCRSQGSGDVVNTVLTLAQQFKNSGITPEDPQFPTLISLDGEIYQSQLIYQINQLFPGKKYIPDITESPLLAYSPMVLMAQSDLAQGLKKVPDPYLAIEKAKNHKEIDPNGPSLNVHYVHTAPTRSNSGLQTLVAQYASVSGKRPENITLQDVQKYQPQIQAIQSKITRYGTSTNSLAKAIVKNGPFWATVGSVYESSVIEANLELAPSTQKFQAIYPKSTFSSNMRAILPNAPWVSPDEKAAAEKIIEFLQTPDIQQIATQLGLRPGTPGVPLGNKFTTNFGVEPQPKYDSYRPPTPEVVEAMLKSWEQVTKKPSLVVMVVDSSGSMAGDKMPAVQNTLLNYVNALSPKDQIAIIDFDSEIRAPVLGDGSAQGKQATIEFINSIKAQGDTKLYDATLAARDWLKQNLRPNAINAVLVLTDGEDSGSNITLDKLQEELKKSGFSSDERIAFFTIGYGAEGEFNPDALKAIAQINSGYYKKGDPATIQKVMRDLQTEF